MGNDELTPEKLAELRGVLDAYSGLCISTKEGQAALRAFDHAFQTTVLEAMLDALDDKDREIERITGDLRLMTMNYEAASELAEELQQATEDDS